MVIVIQSIVDGCDTNAQGAIVQTMLRKYLSQQATVTLDFSGVFNVTSSFVNTAFVELLDDYNFDLFKSLVTIKNVNRQIGTLIKSRMEKEALIAA